MHFVTTFLLLSDPEGKYFITAAVAKSIVVSQPSPWRGQHVTWLWAHSLRGTRAFYNHISPVLILLRFSVVIYRLVYDLLWHCSGFTPVFSRQELTCFTFFLIVNHKVWKSTEGGLTNHHSMACAYKWWEKTCHPFLIVLERNPGHSVIVSSQISVCIHQDFWHMLCARNVPA